jgi:hypothetical protein
VSPFSTPISFQTLSRSDVFALLANKMAKEQQAFGTVSKTLGQGIKASINYNYRYSTLDESIRGLIQIFENYGPSYKSMEQNCSDGDFYTIKIKYTIEIGASARTIE